MEHQRVAVTGATGLIGRALTASLEHDGHHVQRMTRSRDRAAGRDQVFWDPLGGDVETAALEGVDAVVHLAGEPLGDRRWNDDVKREIRDSRTIGTRTLADALASLDAKPAVLVSGSAVGVYGRDRGDEVLDETASLGDDFLARVCREWEQAAAPAADAGIRVATSRMGVVLAGGGPLVSKVELPFKLGVGGRVGHGRQRVAWVGLDDAVRALRFLIDHDVSGPVNVTAPEPVTNRELTSALGEVLHRPTLLPIPVAAIRVVYGEMGVTLATSSQRAVPAVLAANGFEHVQRDLRETLRAAFGRTA